jgi:anti-sigma regulatory factor (Ser/Thr protein kinase)
MMAVVVDDGEWLRLEDDSVISGLRRGVADAAKRLQFPEQRVADIAVAATELATNARRHADDAAGVVRIRRHDADAVVQLLLIDRGPGMRSVDAMFENGVSSGGTLGIGLGVIQRIANRFDIFSVPARGTVAMASFAASAAATLPVPTVDGVTRPMSGEEVCGDVWAAAVDGARTSVIVADGLGHGPLARQASRAAVDAFLEDPWQGPPAILDRADRALKSTRGAAVSVVDYDLAAGRLRFSGVGNVHGRTLGVDREGALLPSPGIVGQFRRRVQEVTMPVARGTVIVLHSDGLTTRWNTDALPGLLSRAPGVVSSVLLREAGIHHDDAAVVVARVA